MNYKYIVVLIAFAMILTGAFASQIDWYNDTYDNDTCLVMYADKSSYEYKNGRVNGLLRFVNSCAEPIENVNLEFYDTSVLSPQISISSVDSAKFKLDSKENITKLTKTVSRDEITYHGILIDPNKITEKDRIYTYISPVSSNILTLSEDLYNRAKYVDDKNGQTHPVYLTEEVVSTKNILFHATQRYPLEKIGLGETIIPFSFQVTSATGEFAFNVEGHSFLDPPYAPYDSGFISDWNFDGSGTTILDVNRTSPHDGTVVTGGGSYTAGITSVNSNFGTAYRLKDGAYITFDNHEDFRSPEFTVSMWVSSVEIASERALFAAMADRRIGQYAGSLLYLNAGVLTWLMGSVDGSATETTMIYPGRLDNSTWRHIVITYDGTSKRMYVDGNLTGTPQTAGLAYNATTYVGIGRAYINNAWIWPVSDTNVDAVTYWDRALSAADINKIWNSGNGLAYPFDIGLWNGVTSYWNLDNNAANRLVTDIAGTYNAFSQTDTNVLATAGKLNTAFNFDGSTSYVDINAVVTPLQETTTGTWSIWAYPTEINRTNTLIMFGNTVKNKQLRLYIQSDNNIGFNVYDVDRGSPTFNRWSWVSTSTNISVNNWYHIVGVHDGIEAKVYLNGELLAGAFTTEYAKSAWFSDIMGDINAGSIGRFYNGAAIQNYFKGKLDEVAIWDRNLSADEIRGLYNKGNGLSYGLDYTLDPRVFTTFNVYRAGTSTHLTGIGFDANVTALDLSGQNSPFSTILYDINTVVSAVFSRAGYDSNTFIWRGDTNATYTIYLTDTTEPSIGTTTTSGFTISGSQIWGTGTISSAVPTDAGSGLDTTTCEYTINNGSNWYAATWDTDKCVKTGITVTTGTTPRFNMRIKDLVGNQGTGTATIEYTADDVGPSVGITTVSGFTVSGTRISGTGDILGGAASDAVSGLNTATCEYTVDNGSNWLAATWNAGQTRCEKTGLTIVYGQSAHFNTRIKDLAANQGTGTATIAYRTVDIFTIVQQITAPVIGTTQTGFMDVNFTIQATEDSPPTIVSSIYVSSSVGGLTNLVYTDTNLSDGIGITCNGYIPFTSERTCTYRFNTDTYADGIYYIDINSWTTTDSNLASIGSFTINNSFDEIPPVVGQTTLTDFAITGAFMSGTGNILGGYVFDQPDYKFGTGIIKIKDDTNFYNSIATDHNGQHVYVTTLAGGLFVSDDYGVTWNIGVTGATNRLNIAASDENGIVISGGQVDRNVDISYDYGKTWAVLNTSRAINDLAISSSGQYMLFSSATYGLQISHNYGNDINIISTGFNPSGAAMSSSGQYMFASELSGSIHKSTDFGVTWTAISDLPNSSWIGLATSQNGKHVAAYAYGQKLYISHDYGNTWELSTFVFNNSSNFKHIYISNEGSLIVIPNGSGNNVLYTSINGGLDFNNIAIGSPMAVDMSDNGYLYLAGSTGVYRQLREPRGLDTSTCQYTINNGINWLTADWNETTQSCTKYGFTVFPGLSYTFNTRIQDLTGNFGYGTATQTYLAASGTPIQFNVTNETSIPLENIDLNIFTITSGVREYYTTIRTDITGVAFALLDSGATYGLDAYQDGILKLSTDNIIITSSTYNLILPGVSPITVIPGVNQITIGWNPSLDYIYSDVLSLVQTISGIGVTDVNMTIYQYLDFNTANKTQVFSTYSACPGSCTVTTLLSAFTVDRNFPFYVDINLGINGTSTRLIRTHKYVLPDSTGMAPLLDLIRNVRGDFACSTDTSLPCGPTIILSIVLTIVLIGSIVVLTGYMGPQGLSIMALAILGILTYVGFFFWILYAVIVLVTILYIGKGVVE